MKVCTQYGDQRQSGSPRPQAVSIAYLRAPLENFSEMGPFYGGCYTIDNPV